MTKGNRVKSPPPASNRRRTFWSSTMNHRNATIQASASPDIGSFWHGGTIVECNSVPCTICAANTATVALLDFNVHLFVGQAVAHNSEVTGRHAIPTANAAVWIHSGHMLRSKHDRECIGLRCLECQTVPITVADAADKRSDHAPYGMKQPFFL